MERLRVRFGEDLDPEWSRGYHKCRCKACGDARGYWARTHAGRIITALAMRDGIEKEPSFPGRHRIETRNPPADRADFGAEVLRTG